MHLEHGYALNILVKCFTIRHVGVQTVTGVTALDFDIVFGGILRF